MKAGILAAKENANLPIFCSMTFEANQRTFAGVSVPAMAAVLEGLGADVILSLIHISQTPGKPSKTRLVDPFLLIYAKPPVQSSFSALPSLCMPVFHIRHRNAENRQGVRSLYS